MTWGCHKNALLHSHGRHVVKKTHCSSKIIQDMCVLFDIFHWTQNHVWPAWVLTDELIKFIWFINNVLALKAHKKDYLIIKTILTLTCTRWSITYLHECGSDYTRCICLLINNADLKNRFCDFSPPGGAGCENKWCKTFLLEKLPL
mgnify:CR=1 FL=1